jgi:DNA polymerase-1
MILDPKALALSVFLIDGSSFLYRAYYGVRPLHTPQGEPVQAVYSFSRMIKKIIDTHNPSLIAVVWDSKGKTTRHEMYEAYKATRQAPPSDMFTQKDRIIEFAQLIGMTQVQTPGIEADDLMYSLAVEQAKAGNDVVFVTSDKDMSQALGEHIFVFDPFKDAFIGPDEFKANMGFPVEKLPFYFALLGDASDNIPGVHGIGKKTAQELVNQFDSLEDMYARLDEIAKPRTKMLLLENKDNAFLSHKLFLLQYHPSGLTKDDLAFDPSNWQKAIPLFEELNFKSLIQEIAPKAQIGFTPEQKIERLKSLYNFQLVTTKEQLDDLCMQLRACKNFAVDTETDGLNSLQASLVGVSFCIAPNLSLNSSGRTEKEERIDKDGGMSEGGRKDLFSVRPEELRDHQTSIFDQPKSATQDYTPDDLNKCIAYYVPCGHITNEAQLDTPTVLAAIKPILEDPKIGKYLHHAKFDQLVFSHHGIEMQNLAFDSLIAANLVTKDWQKVGLKRLAEFYFGEQMLTFDDMVKAKKIKNFSFSPLEESLYYAANDSLQTLKLTELFKKELYEQRMDDLYFKIELPLNQVLYEMECEGIYLDVPMIKRLGVEVDKELILLEEQILGFVPLAKGIAKLNLNSPKQMQELLFVQLGLPTQKKSAKGGYSTDREVLEELSKLHPVPGLMLKYRELFKLKTTYIDALPEFVNPETKRIHTTFSQTSVATGRLSSFDPNLQNIPASGYGIEIRAAFKPQEGHVFLSADYSQIELRVLAFLSKDENLTQAFLHNHDVHKETAARLFDVPLAEVTHEQRQIGKRINFSILYGLTPYGLSKDLGIPFKDAKLYIDKYFAQYPGVSAWMEGIIRSTERDGFVRTYWGRRRDIPAIYEKNRSLYEEAKRIAVNTVAQGTAAEIMKQGMIKLDAELKKQGLDAKIILQIHDELLISVAKNQQEAVQKVVKEILEKVVNWPIPLVVTTRVGADWKEVSK